MPPSPVTAFVEQRAPPVERHRQKAEKQPAPPTPKTEPLRRVARAPAELGVGLGPRSDTTLSVVPGTPEPGSVIFVEVN